MKKTLIVTLVLFMFTGTLLFAQFTPYGSARLGFWYENEDEIWSSTGESRLNMNYFLQANSHFGARYKDGDLSARTEIDANGNIRLLWAKYNMGGYSILIGQDETILNQKGTMTYGCDNHFVGWGAIDDVRKAQIRFDWNNGLSFALIPPTTLDPQGINQGKTVLFPKVNLGYKNKLTDNINFTGAVGFNMYNYDENAGPRDESVMAFVLGLLFDMNFDPMAVKLHFNFGQNTANYGLSSVVPNRAIWDGANSEIVDVTTMGGFGEFSYKMNEKSAITLGVSYTMADCDLFDNADTAMAAFGQFRHQLAKKFWIVPEVGMLNMMQDTNENDQGTKMFFGTQLRMDF